MRNAAVTLSWPGVAVATVGLVAGGIAVGIVATRRSATPPPESMPAADARPAANRPPTPESVGDVTLTLSAEMRARASIETAQVASGPAAAAIRLPGIVGPNTYTQTVVTSLVAGRVETVAAELGGHVRKGQVLARVQSPEVAESRERLVSAQAMLDAHDRELRRLEQLTEIGAASRQELERAHAEHAAQVASIETARARLALLGADAPDGSNGATYLVRAPSTGVVTARTANPGVNVDPATALFTVSDLSTVWVVADVYERDLAAVRVGQPAHVVTGAYPNDVVTGRVTFIDPQMRQDTRTAQVRIQVPNTNGRLRLGMFTDVRIDRAAGANTLSVPASAVQALGDRRVVYVPVPGRSDAFTEREVRVGDADRDSVPVLSGLAAGDTVVTQGAFFLRAEIERLGLRGNVAPATAAPSPAPAAVEPPSAPAVSAPAERQTVPVSVTATGFEPSRVSVRPGTIVTLVFTRTVEETCATEVVVPALNLRKPLPLGRPVSVEVKTGSGEIAFACGMRMFTGAVVAQ